MVKSQTLIITDIKDSYYFCKGNNNGNGLSRRGGFTNGNVNGIYKLTLVYSKFVPYQ